MSKIADPLYTFKQWVETPLGNGRITEEPQLSMDFAGDNAVIKKWSYYVTFRKPTRTEKGPSQPGRWFFEGEIRPLAES